MVYSITFATRSTRNDSAAALEGRPALSDWSQPVSRSRHDRYRCLDSVNSGSSCSIDTAGKSSRPRESDRSREMRSASVSCARSTAQDCSSCLEPLHGEDVQETYRTLPSRLRRACVAPLAGARCDRAPPQTDGLWLRTTVQRRHSCTHSRR